MHSASNPLNWTVPASPHPSGAALLALAGVIYALAYAGYALALLIGRSLADRTVLATGPVRLVRIGGAVAALAVVGVALAPGEVAGLAAFAVLGLGIAAVIPLAFTAAATHDPGHTGVAVARVNVFNYVGFVLGAPLVGLVADAASLRWGFAALAPVALGVVALAPAFAGSPRPPAGTAAASLRLSDREDLS